MYFDAYLKGRNPHNTHLQSQINTQLTTDPASKFNIPRPPIPQSHTVIGKTNYPEQRLDTGKLNTSAHVFLNSSKPNNNSQRVLSNYPVRPETNTGPLGPFSRHQLPEDQKYICHSPAKGGSRTSAGLVFQEIPQNRFDYRRSESIAEVKPGETIRQSSINYYNPQQRQPNDFPQDSRTIISTSPLDVKFNAYAGKVVRKDSEGPLLTNREERPEQPYLKDTYSHKKLFKESHAELFQNKTQIPTFDPNKFQYISSKADPNDFRKYDYQVRKNENQGKKVDGYRTFDEICKNSSTTGSMLEHTDQIHKGSHQDLMKKYSVSKLPDLDKSLDQDIQSLRYTSKKTDEVVDRELNKNNYLNQLFEQKGLKIAEDKDKGDSIREKKEGAAKHISFERELQAKTKEIQTKNKQIESKNEQIEARKQQLLVKSKFIDHLKRELDDRNKELDRTRQELQAKNKEINSKDNQLEEKIRLLKSKKIQIENNSNEFEIKLKQLQTKNKELEDKIKELIDRHSKDVIDKNKQISDKTRQIADKNSQIEVLNTEVKQLQTILLKHQQASSIKQKDLEGKLARITQLQLKLKKVDDCQSVKITEQSKMIELLKEQTKKEISALEKQLAQVTHANHQFEKIIKDMQKSIKDDQVKAEELRNTNNALKTAYDSLKQQSQAQKLSLINLYKKDTEAIKAKFQAEKQTFQKINDQSSVYLQAEVVELRQRSTLAEQDLSIIKKDHKQLKEKYECLRQQYSEVGSLLLLGQEITQEKLVLRIREYMEVAERSEVIGVKDIQRVQEAQLQRLQQEHLERRHQELGRELKKVGSRLACASIEAQQNGRLLAQANSQIVLLHVINLNEKYRFLLENQ